MLTCKVGGEGAAMAGATSSLLALQPATATSRAATISDGNLDVRGQPPLSAIASGGIE